MPLIKQGRIVEDHWVEVADGEPLPADAPVVVSSARWRDEGDALLGRNSPVGLVLGNDDDIAAFAPDVERLGLVVLSFPVYLLVRPKAPTRS